jgi:prevent-host-death family protein
MTINILNDIKSITDLKRHTNDVLKHVQTTGRPVVLTVNGKAEAVLMDAKEYERTSSALGILKLLIKSEGDVDSGRLKDAAGFFKDFKRAKDV